MLSTTEILSQIETSFKKEKPLLGYLPFLIQSLQSKKRVVFSNMNDKQKLSQLQQLIQEQMKKINLNLTSSNMNLDEEIEDQNSKSQNDESQINESNSQAKDNQDEIVQNQMEDQKQDYQDQQDEQEKEFEQPKFQNKNKNLKQPDNYQEQQFNQQEQLPEQMQEEDQNQEDSNNQEKFDSQQDVGLYGQQLNQNDQDIQNYQNQFDDQEFKEFQKQFGGIQPQEGKPKKNKKSKNQSYQNDNVDDNIEDNFDHFRQLQLENQKQEPTVAERTQLDNQIDRLQEKIIGKKDWTMKGQIKGRQRPSNSLLEYDLQFSSGIKYAHQITQERNVELQQLIKKRILSDMFDDRSRYVNTSHIRQHFGSMKQVSRQKSQMGLGELYESQFKNFLGIGDNKNDKLKAQILDSFKQLNYFLDSLSNFSFTPKPTKEGMKKGQSQAIIVQQKVPLTLWNGQKQVQKQGKLTFQSQKQVDNQAKRLKNKRIARQRKKQQVKKKLNKKIEYGGITKFQAQAKQKSLMNNKPLKMDGANMKYNKSGSFFKNMNENKSGKPNPDIQKMKI